jgi:hypothetical protein
MESHQIPRDDIEDDESSETSMLSITNRELGEKQRSQDLIGLNETRNVNRLRFIVFTVLLMSTLAVALTVYFKTRSLEVIQFDEHFNIDATMVLDAIGTSIENTLRAIDVFVISLVSHVHATNQTWPIVMLPDFPIRASKILSASDAIWLQLSPVVTPDERLVWEEFASDNRDWVNDSMKFQAQDDHYHGPVIYSSEYRRSIFGNFAPIPYNST